MPIRMGRGAAAAPPRAVVAFAAVAVLALLGGARAAEAALVLEPEVGVKHFVGTIHQVAGTGPELGATLRLPLTPDFSFTARTDLGFHPGDASPSGVVGSPSVRRIASANFAGGLRLMPLAGRGRLQPYVGAQAGLSALVWSNRSSPFTGLFEYLAGRDTDGSGAASVFFGGEAGLTRWINERVGIECGARFLLHGWLSFTAPDVNSDFLRGHEAEAHVGVAIALGG